MTYITNTARYYTFSSVGLVRATGLIVVCLTIVKSYNMLQHIYMQVDK